MWLTVTGEVAQKLRQGGSKSACRWLTAVDFCTFVMGRKNWLFANTPAGAQASAVIYSLIETAKETGLDPYKYLLWALREAPKLFETDREWAKKLTPEHCTQH